MVYIFHPYISSVYLMLCTLSFRTFWDLISFKISTRMRWLMRRKPLFLPVVARQTDAHLLNIRKHFSCSPPPPDYILIMKCGWLIFQNQNSLRRWKICQMCKLCVCVCVYGDDSDGGGGSEGGVVSFFLASIWWKTMKNSFPLSLLPIWWNDEVFVHFLNLFVLSLKLSRYTHILSIEHICPIVKSAGHLCVTPILSVWNFYTHTHTHR